MADPVPLRTVVQKSWLDKFVDATEGIECPKLFRKWAGVACISGALERKVWSVTWGTVYPNLFVVLTANPGIGKTVIIELVHRLWTSVKTVPLNVAPTTVTKAALIDHYAEHGLRTMPNTLDMFSSCLIAARELGHLITEFDLPFLNTLNDFYDCISVPYIERTRKLGEIKLQEPHMVMLAGAQPAWIASVFPEAAFSMGTASRMIFIYSDEITRAKLWTSLDDDIIAAAIDPIKDRAITVLLPRLERIAELVGCFIWTGDAKKLISKWQEEGYPPVPTHHRLRHYATRRLINVLKLSMIYSAVDGNSLTIQQSHVEEAMKLLFETEIVMPEIFKEMTAASSHSTTVNDLVNWLQLYYAKRGNRPIPEPRMWEFLRTRLPANQIKPTIESLERSGLLKEVRQTKSLSGVRHFAPIRPEDRTDD